MEALEIVLGLLVAVVALVVLAQKVNVPYPILLVLGGLALAVTPGLPRVALDPNIVLLLFLPLLVFQSAAYTSIRDLRAYLGYISLLAFGLVFFTMAAVAFVAHAVMGMDWAPAFVLGIIIAPTDPIAATAVAERLDVPRRIVTIIEGEGLLNDVATFVTYRVAVAAAVTGVFSFGGASLQIVVSATGGTLIGLAIGYVSVWLRRRLNEANNAPLLTMISVLTPFAIYLACERIGLSGITGCVAGGLYVGRRISEPRFMAGSNRLDTQAFWQMIVFSLNGLAFLLIGLQLPIIVDQLLNRTWLDLLRDTLVISVTIVLLRIAWAALTAYLPHALDGPARLRLSQPVEQTQSATHLVSSAAIPTSASTKAMQSPYSSNTFEIVHARQSTNPRWREAIAISWAGMRGVDSLAAAMALPLLSASGKAFPDRDLILFLTFCVILVTLLLQGLSLTPLMARLKLREDDGQEKEEAKARLKSARAGNARLEELARAGRMPEHVVNDLRGHYTKRIIKQAAALDGTGEDERSQIDEKVSAYHSAKRELVEAERQELIRLRDEGVISDEVLRVVQRDLDLEEALFDE